jgi:hypothetical protein
MSRPETEHWWQSPWYIVLAVLLAFTVVYMGWQILRPSDRLTLDERVRVAMIAMEDECGDYGYPYEFVDVYVGSNGFSTIYIGVEELWSLPSGEVVMSGDEIEEVTCP